MEKMKERLMQHLSVLSNEIGSRPVGSEANHAASIYIENIFRDAGLEVETQEFEVPEWKLTQAYLEIDGNRLEAKGNNFSAPCEVNGEIVPFCTIEELSNSLDLTGKIAFLYGELSKENYVPKGFSIYNPDHHKHTIRLLEEKKPSAIIFVQMQTQKNLPVINDWDFSIPSVTVSPEVGLKIKGNQSNTKVTCIIKSDRKPGITKNIIGKVKGVREEKIIFSAHYDTVFDTNGAFDNGSGVATVLTLAEEIAKRNEWKTGFEFIAFSSEEYLGLGDDVYLNNHKESLNDALIAMNFDGIGQTLGTNNVTLMNGSDKLETHLKLIKNKFPSIQWGEPWYASNHYTFFSNGVPSIPFNSNGIADLLHTEKDTLQWISEDKLLEVYTIANEFIKDLQDKKIQWTRGE